MQLNNKKSGSSSLYSILLLLLLVVEKAVSSGTLVLVAWSHTSPASSRHTSHYIASLQAHSKRRLKPIHQSNRLTGRTGITQPTHSLVINLMPSKRYNHINLTITANRAFDENPMPSRRAFRGMAGLAVLYPSVVDYIGWSIKTLWASYTGL